MSINFRLCLSCKIENWKLSHLCIIWTLVDNRVWKLIIQNWSSWPMHTFLYCMGMLYQMQSVQYGVLKVIVQKTPLWAAPFIKECFYKRQVMIIGIRLWRVKSWLPWVAFSDNPKPWTLNLKLPLSHSYTYVDMVASYCQTYAIWRWLQWTWHITLAACMDSWALIAGRCCNSSGCTSICYTLGTQTSLWLIVLVLGITVVPFCDTQPLVVQ